MIKPSTGLVLKTLASESLRGLLTLPLWWYSGGLLRAMNWMWTSIKSAPQMLGVNIWAKNLFIPMYGETGFVGRAISFSVRLFVICFKGAGVVFWTVGVVCMGALYLVGLPILLTLFFWSLTGMLL